jgi:translocation and assembly module TamA
MAKKYAFLLTLLLCCCQGAEALPKSQVPAQLKITRVDLKITGPGASDPAFKNLSAHFLLHPGMMLETKIYDKAKRFLFNAADQTGYLDAELLEHEIRVNRASHTAIIKWHFDTGPRYFFGAITFSKTPLSNAFLQRFVPFKSGQAYSSSEVLALQDALNNSSYFSQVSVQPGSTQARTREIPIQVNLQPRPAQQYSFGAGYGTDTGLRANLGWDWRYLTENGHHFSALVRLSQVQNSLQAVYTIPGKNPLTDQNTINASVLRNDYPDAVSMTQRIGVANIRTYDLWHRTISLGYQQEHDDFDSTQASINSKLLIPGITWQYLKTDNPIYPRQGNRFTLMLQGASKHVLSDTSLIQGEISDKYIRRLTPNMRILLRGDVGYTSVENLTTELPLSLSFFAGGTESVRGYKYQSLGPGRYLAVGSVELQHRIVGNWNAAILYDVGNAYNNFPTRLMRGAGVGLVWKSPVGPLNLYLAKALDLPGKPMQVQFSMGADL